MIAKRQERREIRGENGKLRQVIVKNEMPSRCQLLAMSTEELRNVIMRFGFYRTYRRFGKWADPAK